MKIFNQFGPEGEKYADVLVDGELWTIGPNNACGFTCEVKLFWEVHFYPNENNPNVVKRVGRWFIRNAASDEN